MSATTSTRVTIAESCPACREPIAGILVADVVLTVPAAHMLAGGTASAVLRPVGLNVKHDCTPGIKHRREADARGVRVGVAS